MSTMEMRYQLLTRLIDSGYDFAAATRRVARIMLFVETGIPEATKED